MTRPTLHLKKLRQAGKGVNHLSVGQTSNEVLPRMTDDVNMPQEISAPTTRKTKQFSKYDRIDIAELSKQLVKLPFVERTKVLDKVPDGGGCYIRLYTSAGSDVRLVVYDTDSVNSVKRRLNTLMKSYVNQQINKMEIKSCQ